MEVLMKSEDLFQLRSSLVNAGFSDTNAEKAASALECAVADKIDDVMKKWESKFQSELDLKLDLIRRDMTIRLGLMLLGSMSMLLAVLNFMLKH
jgi:hypothetical protein